MIIIKRFFALKQEEEETKVASIGFFIYVSIKARQSRETDTNEASGDILIYT